MTRIWKRTGTAISITLLTTLAVVVSGGIAHADNIQDTIADTGAGITLVAGAGTGASAGIRLIGNNSGGDADPGCNIDPGEAPLVLDILTPAGVTANPDPLSITACGIDFPVTFTASSSAVSGNVTVRIVSGPAGSGSYFNQVLIPLTVTQPTPTNTKPSVAVTGVVDGASYEIGAVPDAMCAVTDAEDGASSTAAVLSGTLFHGLGALVATCDATDSGGLSADTATATFTIVDTGSPTIEHVLAPAAPNGDKGWYTTDVAVSFSCSDTGSGIASCVGDTTLDEGAEQSVTGTATDWAGNTQTDTVTGINVDKTAPAVELVGGPGASYYFGDDPAAPTCEASDALSGLASCVVTGGGSTVGAHSYVATATDNAGNTSTATLNYTVLAWTPTGFYSPVDMGSVWNTVKGGSTVPLKFEVFAGTTELTSTAAVDAFRVIPVACPGAAATADAIEFVTTGGTSLRYDSTAGQFIQNWSTPKKAGACFTVVMTTDDGSSVSANFKLK
ncbi:PxKF domain-containing protein [Diaminobutyricimonas sp. TR449]|uniref:PxKF domain-containing protein n=1 Tax=Diaminobutyricimonas sp. TR449 TaxID=2708076 RepID=UPI0014220D28|nr:PxKF domain-containing protein [Diaminobutyricimonas sp. TR449]